MQTQVLQQPVIERAVITVQNIMPAPGAGKSARIKDSNGVMFGIWPDKLNNVAIGETYEIEYTSKVANGTTWRDIKQIRINARPSPAPAQFTAGQPSEAKGNNQFYRPTSPKDARRMFLCSTLNAFIQTGRVDMHREHLKQAIGEILAAYDATVALED